MRAIGARTSLSPLEGGGARLARLRTAGSDLDAAQEIEEQRQFLPAEQIDEACLVLDHLAPQHSQLVSAYGGQEQVLSPPVCARGAPLDPSLLEQLANESDDGCLVDRQLRGELDLRDPGILVDEYEQAEDARPDHAAANRTIEIAPQGHVRAPHVVAEEIR